MDKMDKLDYREILRKKPFFRTLPNGYLGKTVVTSGSLLNEPEDYLKLCPVTQADFLRELDPNGHRIYDRSVFPDVLKKDPDTGKMYEQPVTRVSFAFQQLIATKQTITVCGNDLQFELADEDGRNDEDATKTRGLNKLRTAWLEMGGEIRLFDSVYSLKTTGDAAVVGFIKDGNPYLKVLSFREGDKLYPTYDSVTGELTLFARRYNDYDEDGSVVTQWVEVWDEKYLYRCKQGAPDDSLFGRIKDIFGIGGYRVVEKKLHGFDFLPVAYIRDDGGACWGAVQNLIERYEESFSYFCENNKAFAFPIFYVKGDEIDIQGDMNGAVKAVSVPTDGDAGFLNRQDVSTAFNTQLKELYKLIYELSFAVQPPELKSGDLPGVALKLLYSPAIEKAMKDASLLQPFVDKMLKIVKFAYGKCNGCLTELMGLKVNAWLEPYVHQNDTELTSNLAMAVQNDFLSHQTASERIPKYAKTGEWDRIVREAKEEQQQTLLGELRSEQIETEESVRRQAALARIKNGSDLNTGRGVGGRPNLSGVDWDENGNYDGRNGWRRGEEYKQ